MILLEDAKSFDCHRSAVRDPRETKVLEYDVTTYQAEYVANPEAIAVSSIEVI